jgi:hypothetical protein
MRRHSLYFALAAALLVPGLRAQDAAPQPAAPTPAAACLSTATLDQLITAIDAAVSGVANQDRTCFRALFLPDARLIPIKANKDGSATPTILTVDDWINLVAKRGKLYLIEKQIKVSTESWAHVAHLWSTYETHLGSADKSGEGKPTEGKLLDRGINSIQAIYDGKQWHVIEITWQAQTSDDPVPAKYLP